MVGRANKPSASGRIVCRIILEISSGLQRKRPALQPEYLDRSNSTHDQKGVLQRMTSQRKEVHLVFILIQVLTVPFPHWLGSNFTILLNWLVWEEMAHRKWRRKGKQASTPKEKRLQAIKFPNRAGDLSENKGYWVERIKAFTWKSYKLRR